MRSRLTVRRLRLPRAQPTSRPSATLRYIRHHSRLTSTGSRPVLPFLSSPSTTSGSQGRHFTSKTKAWLRREIKTAIKYTLIIWGFGASVLLMLFAIREEMSEREFPTPHEWKAWARKHLRDIKDWSDPKDGQRQWAKATHVGGVLLRRLEDPNVDGKDVVKLGQYEVENPDLIPCDVSAKSEEWRRGYLDALRATARAAEHTEGWMHDTVRGLVVPGEFVVGPSNPRPKPIPPNLPATPREEDCVPAFPSAADYYLKISRTAGFTPEQQLEARLDEAAYWEYMGELDTARECLADCLLLANGESKASAVEEWIRVDKMTPVKRTGGSTPSANMLDVVTSLAGLYARSGELSHALTAYLSLLHARRSLSSTPPPATPEAKRPRRSLYRQIVDAVSPPPYPPPPPSGFDAPWRSPEERCQEAALQVHIGEILFATSSREEGLAWTRDGVDGAEEQMRALGPPNPDLRPRQDTTRNTCRDCLAMGLENWKTMVARMAAAERKKLEEKEEAAASGSSWGLSFWKGGNSAEEGRWMAEEKVVTERLRRTKELVDAMPPPKENPLMSLFRA